MHFVNNRTNISISLLRKLKLLGTELAVVQCTHKELKIDNNALAFSHCIHFYIFTKMSK